MPLSKPSKSLKRGLLLMTHEDLAWVQGQLRGCANARRQLRICAECLCLTDDELLTHLGYTSIAAFRAAHPQSKHPVGQQVERIHHPVPPDVMLESILRYYGGDRLSSVCSLMGYTQPVTREAIRHRVCTWRKKHPALAAGMPPKRPNTPIKEKAMELNIDATGLPAYAYARSPYTGGIVRIVRGERALFGVNNQTCVDELNAAAGVTRAQAAAMYNGAMCGWGTPYSDPTNYSETGSYVGPETEEPNGTEC